jgi:hypothetical protein
LILLAVFAEPIYEIRKPLIRELVIVAIKGIESAKFGPYLETRAIQHQEKSRLQHALVAHFDADRDGRLNAVEADPLNKQTGLTRDQVEGSALDVELDPLVAANHAVGLLSRTRTANDIRRDALTAALAERDREHEALWEEAGSELEIQRPAAGDYLRWETWRHGLAYFLDVLRYRLPFGPHLIPGPRLYEESDRGLGERSLWQNVGGLLVVLVLAGAVLVSIRRYGKGKELERRFIEDLALAAAPCPVCGETTNDYGALRQHRLSRACATAAVVGLAFFAVGPLGLPQWLYGVGIVAIPATGIVRWILWPREVHVCHRRPSLLYVGFTAALLLVVGLISGIATYGMNTLDYPQPHVAVVAGPRRGQAMQRRRDAATTRPNRRPTERRGQHRPARGTPKEPSTPAVTRSPARDAGIGRGVRGAEPRASPDGGHSGETDPRERGAASGRGRDLRGRSRSSAAL